MALHLVYHRIVILEESAPSIYRRTTKDLRAGRKKSLHARNSGLFFMRLAIK